LFKHRSISGSSSIADSVNFRVTNDSSYRPENLTIQGNALGAGYQKVGVIGSAAAAGA